MQQWLWTLLRFWGLAPCSLSIQHPQLTSKMIKLKQLAGDLPKRLTPAKLRHATVTQIKDVVGASMTVGGSVVNGNFRTIAVGLYEAFEE